MPQKVFLLADGEPMAKSLRDHLRRGRFTVAIDGAAEQARKERWLPDLIAGDFDTAKPATLAYFGRKKVTILQTPDQNHTDLEKALAWSIGQGAKSIWIAQALGNRLDHSLANLIFLKRFHGSGREIFLFTPTEKIRFVKDETLRLKGALRRPFALIPFPFCKATSSGLEYDLGGREYKLGFQESVSNRAMKASVQLTVEGEALVIEGI